MSRYSLCMMSISQSSATLIDNLITNNIDMIDKDDQGVLVTDITDHSHVFVNYCHNWNGLTWVDIDISNNLKHAEF